MLTKYHNSLKEFRWGGKPRRAPFTQVSRGHLKTQRHTPRDEIKRSRLLIKPEFSLCLTSFFLLPGEGWCSQENQLQLSIFSSSCSSRNTIETKSPHKCSDRWTQAFFSNQVPPPGQGSSIFTPQRRRHGG